MSASVFGATGCSRSSRPNGRASGRMRRDGRRGRLEHQGRLVPLARHRVRRLEDLAGLQLIDPLLSMGRQEVEQNFYFFDLDERDEGMTTGAFGERRSPALRVTHPLASDDELSQRQDVLITQPVDGFHERSSEDTGGVPAPRATHAAARRSRAKPHAPRVGAIYATLDRRDRRGTVKALGMVRSSYAPTRIRLRECPAAR